MKPVYCYHMPRKGRPNDGPACGNTPKTLKHDPQAKAVACPQCLDVIRDERVGIYRPGFEPGSYVPEEPKELKASLKVAS